MARIVITGTSTGIGEAAARALSAGGHDVIATVRTAEAAAALEAKSDSATLSTRLVDVTSHDAVASLIFELDQAAPIDVLINNAGVGTVGTLEELSDEALRYCMEVNFFAVATATRAALTVMRERGHGKIICVTSVGGIVGQPFNDAYCAAKFAVEGLYESLHPVASSVGVSVSVVEPGPVATAFVANVKGIDSMLETDASLPYGRAKANYLARVGGQFQAAQPASEVATLLASIVEESAPRLRYQTSPWSTAFVGTKLGDLDGDAVTSMTREWIA